MSFFLSSKFKKPDKIPKNLKKKVTTRTYNDLIHEKDQEVIDGNYKNFEIYSMKWMAIWKYHKNLQEEMLEDAKERSTAQLHVLW